MSAYWNDEGCPSCHDLVRLAAGLQEAVDRLSDEVDVLTIQLDVCRVELASQSFTAGQERMRADDYERRLDSLRDYPDADL